MKLFFILIGLWIMWHGVHAQKLFPYALQEQMQLDSLIQDYLHKGIPREWAERRAYASMEKKKTINKRTSVYGALPVSGSIWIDRDSITGAPNASHAHNFTPEQFVKDIFVRGGREIADHVIRNVTFISSTWKGSAVNTWNNRGHTGPYGGDVGMWLNNDREMLYFDHGDTTTMVPTWDGMGQTKYFGIDKGILLSTGSGLYVEGDNEDYYSAQLDGGYDDWAEHNGGSFPPVYPIDPDLPDIETKTSLEFDFRSFADSVTFQFVFASEEFPQWSNSTFNDAFGFFVSGPGLTDEWGNTGDTINIARFPDGSLITINNSNWGYRDNNLIADFDPSGATPVKTAPYYVFPDENKNAVNPQYHIPVYNDVNPWLMEYNGQTILLTAKVKLRRNTWYHMKLAVANVGNNEFGSGVFLKAGSFDLGAPESEVQRPYMKIPYDSIYGYNSLYMDCENTLLLKFDTLNFSRTVKVWSEGSGAQFIYETDSNTYFKDSLTYLIPPKDSLVTIKFKIDQNVVNGSQARFLSRLTLGGGQDSTEVFDLYAKSKTTLMKYHRPTTNYPGLLDISTQYGSPYIQRSLDNGQNWEFARNIMTGEPLPFTKSQIANIEEDEFYVIFREPNTCCNNDTVFVGAGVGDSFIERLIVMPQIPGAISDYPPGDHYVISGEDFVFTITPIDGNAGHIPVIRTSRITIPDSEGVKIEKNKDGSYTVAILHIQEPLELFVTFVNTSETVETSRAWSSGDFIYVFSGQACEASIYTVSGTLVRTLSLSAGETVSIPLAKGFYIIQTERETHKVIIK